MASLRDSVKDYQEELRDGIAWVAFWKQPFDIIVAIWIVSFLSLFVGNSPL